MAFDRHDPDESVPRPEDPERAVELFARLLESSDDPLHPDLARFDELLRRHPELRDELLLIRDGMEKFQSIRRRLPRLQVVRGARRWRWVGAWIAAAAVVALATTWIVKDRAPQDHRAPIEKAAVPPPAGDPGIVDAQSELVDAGIDWIEGICQKERGELTSTPVPAAANAGGAARSESPDPVVVARSDRRLETVVNVLTAVQQIDALPHAGASSGDASRRERIRGLIASAPATWRDRLEGVAAKPDGSISDAAPLLLALVRDPKLQALLLAKQKEGALPQVLTELADAAAAPALLTLKAIDLDHGAIEIAGAPVFVQSIDPVTGLLGTPSRLGQTPLDDFPLVAGDWRITVLDGSAAGSRHSELRLMAMPNEELAPRVAFFRTVSDPGKGMARLSASSFHFGAPPNAKAVGDSNLPFSTESASEFWLDRTEVTCQDYSDFFREVQSHPEWFGGAAPLHRPNVLEKDGTCLSRIAHFPIVDVTWEEAVVYANWAGKRLPTEREWERAARGPLDEDRKYPWGAKFPPDGKGCVNLSASIFALMEKQASSKDPLPPSIEAGHLDRIFVTLDGCDVADRAYSGGATPGIDTERLWRLGDNAMEYVEDLYVTVHGDAPELMRSASVARVAKGASWNTVVESNCTNWSRSACFPDRSSAINGFRCAMTERPFVASK